MHLDVVASLRCPAGHEPTWLVARTDRVEARHLIEGVLGCPSCGTEYPVHDAVARFGAARRGPLERIPDAAVRAAALLDLTTPHGLVVLAGAWAAAALDLAAMVEEVHLLALDPPDDAFPPGLGISAIEAGDVVPLASGSARGVALDAAHGEAATVEQSAQSLRAGGRLLAPATATVPALLVELARDGQWWVAERPALSPIVTLAGGRRRDIAR